MPPQGSSNFSKLKRELSAFANHKRELLQLAKLLTKVTSNVAFKAEKLHISIS
jgi:hypothetical protein